MFKRFLATLAAISFLVSPLTASASTYVIARGDTLTSIAQRFDVSVADLVSANGITNPDLIFAGSTLEVDSPSLLGGPGGSYTPVTAYQSRTTSFISTSATTIPVASTKDKSGNQIVLSSISSSSTVRVYLSVDTGTSKEEIVACTGITVI